MYDAQAAVVWEYETPDTDAELPAAVEVAPGVQYMWKVAARMGVGRWVSSELAAFTISEP